MSWVARARALEPEAWEYVEEPSARAEKLEDRDWVLPDA
jgi:hypothetical protein